MARKYSQKTHKYRVRIPKSVKEALQVDKENGDTMWWDAIFRPAFQVHEGAKADLPIGYQQIKCHMIFDVKMGKTSDESRD